MMGVLGDLTLESSGVPQRRWKDLNERTRRLIVVLAVFEGILKVLALLDIRRRPTSEIRGSKAGWVVAIVLANSAGAVPISYFVYGRRTPRPSP
jgi:hypothetical protein